jgi:hypothetical protein
MKKIKLPVLRLMSLVLLLGLAACATNPKTSDFYSTDQTAQVENSSSVFICNPGSKRAAVRFLNEMIDSPLSPGIQVSAFNYTAGYLLYGEAMELRLPEDSRNVIWFSLPHRMPGANISVNGRNPAYLIMLKSEITKNRNYADNTVTHFREWSFRSINRNEYAEICGGLNHTKITHKSVIKR